MSELYPAGPDRVPEALTAATPRYRRHAWIAMAALTVFVLLYMALAGWFAYKAYSLIAATFTGGKQGFLGIVFGLPAAFLALFMLKALVFLRHGGQTDDLEIKAGEQPQLFAFLNRLADEAGAPRPHRVFLSARVNAAVFYDLSILNFLFPSKKNLEIGLGLVNALSLSEFKAVLAHEFGHFAQRSMAVGRWVYMAQQIAEHIVWRRDQLDRFLLGLSRQDVRIAWIGWLLRLVVWSIRSLLETLFQLVMLAQRALSREMEMQADLVAVALTGSDALIHALHQAQAADDAWDRTLAFANSELHQGRKPVDLFAIQTRVIELTRQMLGDPDYGRSPALPPDSAQSHRVFRPELAHPPRMWLTHPHNHEREENAKRVYLRAPIDTRPAWSVFVDAQALREQVSLRLAAGNETAPAPIADSLAALEREYAVESLHPRYRGVYLGRSTVRVAAQVAALYAQACSGSASALADLYAPIVAEQLAQWRNLEKEIHLLERVRSGDLTPQGGVVHHRERELSREQLPRVIAQLRGESAQVQAQIEAHDRRCRGEHLAAARAVGNGWAEYLQGLLAAHHYADHSLADLRDAQRFLAREYQVVTADGKVSGSERNRLIKSSAVVHGALLSAYGNPALVALDTALLQRMQLDSWAAAFSEFKLPPADSENLGKWLDVIDGWINSAAQALALLRDQSLELLLESERRVAEARAAGASLPPAPVPSHVGADYPRLLPGQERKLQQRLDWWDRFQTADGWVPAGARLAVAGSIVAGVVGLGGAVGNSTLTIYNGLATSVRVDAGTQSRTLAAFQTTHFDVPLQPLPIKTVTAQGVEIEAFDASVDIAFADYVYNIAGAAPLVQWTAVYGSARSVPERPLGAARWSSVDADVLFAEPPETISTKSGSGQRTVIDGYGQLGPEDSATLLKDDSERDHVTQLHARWDDANSEHILEWLQAASAKPAFAGVLQARLAAQPDDVVLRRAAQDYAGDDRSKVCERDTAAASSALDNPDLQYLAARCIDDGVEQSRAFRSAYERWPEHGWLAFAAGYDYAQAAQWEPAQRALETARARLRPVAARAGLDLSRIERMLGQPPQLQRTRVLSAAAPGLAYLLKLEGDASYVALQQGRLDVALAGDPDQHARILRLAAASSGADAKMVSEGLNTASEVGIDAGTIGGLVGLALREHADMQPWFDRFDAFYGSDGQLVRRFAEGLGHTDSASLEALLRGCDPAARGQAYVIGVVALGARAPATWKQGAERLLYAAERPLL